MPRHIDTHTIRLRGPWEYQWLLPSDDEPQSWSAWSRIKMPCDWKQLQLSVARQIASEGKAASVGLTRHSAPSPRSPTPIYRFRRAFGCPTCLDPHEQVVMVLDQCWTAGVWLNGTLLGQTGAEFEITAHLRERNELLIEITLPLTRSREDVGANDLLDTCPIGEVRLEIRG